MTGRLRGIAVAAMLGFGAISLMDVVAHAEPGVFDDRIVCRAVMMYEVPCIIMFTGVVAVVSVICVLCEQGFGVRALQDYYVGIIIEKV